jgi:hypothetical protein
MLIQPPGELLLPAADKGCDLLGKESTLANCPRQNKRAIITTVRYQPCSRKRGGKLASAF